eukprot:4110006-Amphidinium_carterae.1
MGGFGVVAQPPVLKTACLGHHSCFDNAAFHVVMCSVPAPRTLYGTASRLFLVSYNCLSLLAPGRLSDILHQYRSSAIVVLQGTRVRSLCGEPSVALVDGFLHYCFGYNDKSCKHAGISILLNTRYFSRKHIKTVRFATGKLAGRA